MLDVNELAKTITTNTPFEARATILGHIQRGGTPTPRDRVLASLMGAKAIEEIDKGTSGCCICDVNGQIIAVPFEEALSQKSDKSVEKYKVFKELW